MSRGNINIALLGNPNCGKTALFNALTGSKQRVANYAGVTVEKKHGYFITPKNKNCTLIDLPGTYSLRGRSPDEKITREVVLSEFKEESAIDLVLCIIDATNMQNGLRLVLELKKTGLPIVVALNMIDLAHAKGYVYDIKKLSAMLGVVVIETAAVKNIGIKELVASIDGVSLGFSTAPNLWQEPSVSDTRELHITVAKIMHEVQVGEAGTPSGWSDKIDQVLLHPVFGVLILLGVLFVLFQAVFTWSSIPQDVLQSGVDWLKELVLKAFPGSLFGSLLGKGVISGAGTVLVYLPQILTISLFVILLEDSGYMARAAFLMDKIMSSCGLHGKAFIPLLSSFACAIPGIMATRTIENRNDRLVTILISPLMTCSARLPIYTLLISAFVPARTIGGFFSLQGIIMFGLYAIGIVFALLVAFVFKIFFFRGQRQPSIVELPSYKLPRLRNVIIELIKPAKSFTKRAGTIIVAIMVILWFLSSFPEAPLHATMPAINYSMVAIIGKYIQPIFAPIGFSWQLVAALIPGLAAREVAVSALGTIYALSGTDDVLSAHLATVLQHSWTLATALSLITWYVFAPQCASTLAVARRETNSLRWPLIMFSYQIALAYAMAAVVYHLTLALM